MSHLADTCPTCADRSPLVRSPTADPGSHGSRSDQDLNPLHVLFVCTANICRSPYMELVSRRLVAGHRTVHFLSAGTHGSTGKTMDRAMAERLQQQQIDSARFRSRALRPRLVRDADLVLTAESRHRTTVLQDQPAAARKVFTLGEFAEAMHHTPSDLRGRALIARAAQTRRSADSHWDVPDPYRQPADVVDAVASRLLGLITLVVPRL